MKTEHEKDLARKAVQRAVKSGRLIRPKRCEECFEELPVQGHHDDYDKPLAVLWLCLTCHVDRHYLMKECPGLLDVYTKAVQVSKQMVGV